MRRLPPVVLLAGLALLAGCSSGGHASLPAATPTPLVVAADPALADAARFVLAAAGLEDPVVGPEQSDAAALTLSFAERPGFDGEWLAYRRWAVVVPYSFTPAQLTGPDVVTAFTAPPAQTSGAPEPLALFVPAESRDELAAMLGHPLAASVRLAPLADAPAIVAATPSALGLLPADAVDFHLTALDVDGANPVLGTGDLSSYPLTSRIWLGTRSGADAGDVEAPRTALRHLQLEPAGDTPLRAVFTGDVIPARCVYARMAAADDYHLPFEPLHDYLAAADLLAGSVDASLSDAGEPIGCRETFSLLAPARAVEGLSYAEYDVVSIAANHAKDCGAASCGDQAFLDTLTNLRDAGIAPAGGGLTEQDARQPAILTVRGVRFAFLAYDDIAPAYHATADSPGTAALEETALSEDIAAARQRADVVVVMPHWGVEYTAVPTERQQRLAAVAADAGATLVVGNHAHWVAAAQWYPGSFVAYGLGNFVFDQDWSVATMQGAVLEAYFRGPRLVAVRYLAVRINSRYQPEWAAPDEAAVIIDRIASASTEIEPGAP